MASAPSVRFHALAVLNIACAASLVGSANALEHVRSDADFEAVLDDPVVWAVLFTSDSSEATAGKSADAKVLFDNALQSLAPLVKGGIVDVAEAKAGASEFNIRARRCPKLLLFTKRARDAEVLDLGGGGLSIDAQVRTLLVDNAVAESGEAMKATLAVGGPGSAGHGTDEL